MLKNFDPARHGGEAMADALVGAERIGFPSADWGLMRSTFGDPLLTRLRSITPGSMLRYAQSAHVTPERVLKRLGWLAAVTFDLAGGYNHQGVRRWFARRRAQLDGQSPLDALGKRWSPVGKAASRVRALALLVAGTEEVRPRYEADDGPLTPRQVDAVRKLAAASLSTGKAIGKKKLL